MHSRLIFFSSALQQPRHQRRINVLSKKFDLLVAYVLRDKYKGNLRKSDATYTFLGELDPKDGKFKFLCKRALINLKFLYLCLTDRHSILYLTAPDQALIAALLGRKYFIEYGDIQTLSKKSFFGRYIDKLILVTAKGIIVTSQAYIDGYFAKLTSFEKDKFCVAENKVPESSLDSLQPDKAINERLKSRNYIRLGLVGALSRNAIYKIYSSIVDKNPEFTLEIYGDGDLRGIDIGSQNINYHGPFRNPDDLNNIYSNIDFLLVNYDAGDANVRLALPNKLYEAMLFRVPIICTEQTYLAELVKEKGIGVDSELEENSILDALKRCHNRDFSRAWAALKFHEYVSDNDHVCDFIFKRLEVEKQ